MHEACVDQLGHSYPDDAFGLGLLRVLLRRIIPNGVPVNPMLNVPRTFLLVTAILLAGSITPSPAHAHGGHAHTTPAVDKASSTEHQAALQQRAAKPSINRLAKAGQKNEVPATSGCADHCCGGANGMSCCGSALLPQICFVPFFETYTRFVIRDLPAPTGIPPDALPKPPKSFA